MQKYCIKTSSNIRFGYLLESPKWADSNKYPKHNVLLGNKNKTKHFFCIILPIKDSLQQQIHFNGNIFWDRWLRCNEVSLYVNVDAINSRAITAGCCSELNVLETLTGKLRQLRKFCVAVLLKGDCFLKGIFCSIWEELLSFLEKNRF